MSDSNQKNDGKLGIKLGVNKLSINTDGLKRAPDKVVGPHNNRNKVVVVTKNSVQNKHGVRSDNDGLTEHERRQRLAVLKQAGMRKQNDGYPRPHHTRAPMAAPPSSTEQELSTETKSLDTGELHGTPASEQAEGNIGHKTGTGRSPDNKPRYNDHGARGKVRNLDKVGRHHQNAQTPAATPATAQPAKRHEDANKATVEERSKFKKKDTGRNTEVAEREISINRRAGQVKRMHKDISANDLNTLDVSGGDDDTEVGMRRGRSLSSIKRARERARRQHEENRTKEKIVREVLLPEFITVQELSNRMAEKATDVMKSLINMGMMVTINQPIDADTAEIIVTEFGHTIKRVSDADIERNLLAEVFDETQDMKTRPPVVTVMGHVDHGKTSLLDALRETDIAAKEAGGITQHIGAYQVTLQNGRHITFLDTPGHEAFTAMRSRGARVTDIVVLVVAADDGIMTQTIEAINHAKSAEVPIIVAINKMDKPDANPTRVKNELLMHNLIPEEMGGDTIVVEVSAKAKQGLDRLEEVILLQADVMDLQAGQGKQVSGVVIESQMDKGRGPVATLLVQAGTLKAGDIVVAGTAYGKIRALLNDHGRNIPQALPSMPVEVIGLSSVPSAGDQFVVTPNEKMAKDVVELRTNKERQKRLLANSRLSMEQMFANAGAAGAKEVNVIIKADTKGSAEAIATSLTKLSTDEVVVKIAHSGVGGVTESDVSLASACKAVILAFNVRSSNQARDLAKTNSIDIRYYSIIYNLIDDVKAAMSGMLSPIVREEYLGTAEIRQVFNITKVGKVAGCFVTDGLMRRNASVRLIRDNVVIHDGKLKILKRFKEDVREVRTGLECGMSFDHYEDIKVGDNIECYELKEEARTL
ncbi:MAG: translation initiation factor IF-2 [Proteobacteria bacterium]|nr:translation initiation factor IF-2 [Pseudomonadota bacterium]